MDLFRESASQSSLSFQQKVHETRGNNVKIEIEQEFDVRDIWFKGSIESSDDDHSRNDKAEWIIKGFVGGKCWNQWTG